MFKEIEIAVAHYNSLVEEGAQITIDVRDGVIKVKGSIYPIIINGYGQNGEFRVITEVIVSEDSYLMLPEERAVKELQLAVKYIQSAIEYQMTKPLRYHRLIKQAVLRYDNYVMYYDMLRTRDIKDLNNLGTIAEMDLVFTSIKELHNFVKENLTRLKIDNDGIHVHQPGNLSNRHLVDKLNSLIDNCIEVGVPSMVESLDGHLV